MKSFNYLVPALFWNATVLQVQNLGNISTGGTQLLGQVIKARLYSEPGFEPSFSADFHYGEDYVTSDPGGDGIGRPNLIGVVAPDNGDTPFVMQVSGIQFGTPVLDEIIGTNTSTGKAVPYGGAYSVWVPTFRGGSAKYANLQNSIFVASETVSDSPVPGQFYVGMKISKVFCTNTSVVIGEEFP